MSAGGEGGGGGVLALTPSAPASRVRAALAGAVRRGVDVGPLLERAGICAQVLDDPRARVSRDQFVALTKALWLELDDELLGFGRVPSRVGTFAMMTHAVVHCSADLREALRRAGRFYGLFPSGPRLELVEGDGLARAVVDVSDCDDPDRFAAESLLVVWHRFASWLIRRRVTLERVELAYAAPPHVLEYGPMFGAACVFGARRSALVFDRAYLDQPVVQDEAALRAFLRRAPWDVFAQGDYGRAVSAQVRRLLNQALGEGAPLPGPQRVAARLAVSPQTLRRRLAAEGTTFQRVRDELRRDVAVAALGRGQASIGEVSARLGFSEPSAFHRAFKRWTGATPRSYRPWAGDAPLVSEIED